MQLTGIHHLTAITADAPANKRFYTDTLGLRLVKKTVNQDDTSAYHLFYADGEATPGTDLTFFDWPVAAERRGTHSISRTGLRVSGEETLNYWAARLKDLGVNAETIKTLDGRATLDFEDPEGQRFRLVDDGGPAAELHVAIQPGLPSARQGAGAVHHVAFRTADIEASRDWAARLSEFRVPNSGEVERYYFRSLYFREPGGNLFEIATDGPGFTADEPLESLGERLALPPFLEGQRTSIEVKLKPLD
jgi:glyoxalase family protein